MTFDAKKVKNEIVKWIQDFFYENGKDCNAVVGISGGKDSSVVAALCVEALGKDRVKDVSNISKILRNSFYCGIITYHKEFTPDFLEQKKIRNFGDMEFTQVRGNHKPIITEEEYDQAQKRINSRRKTLSVDTSGQRMYGEKPPSDVWVKLLECECGHKFNRKMWHNTTEGKQYGYQCYSSIRTGTVRTRLNGVFS